MVCDRAIVISLGQRYYPLTIKESWLYSRLFLLKSEQKGTWNPLYERIFCSKSLSDAKCSSWRIGTFMTANHYTIPGRNTPKTWDHTRSSVVLPGIWASLQGGTLWHNSFRKESINFAIIMSNQLRDQKRIWLIVKLWMNWAFRISNPGRSWLNRPIVQAIFSIGTVKVQRRI